METIKLGSETRKRRADANSETTVHDTDPPRRLRPAGGPGGGPPPRPWLVPVAVLAVGLVLFGVYRLGVSRGEAVSSASDAAPSAQPSTRVLLVDPVCHRAVDPANAPAVLDFGGKSIYFDSLDCLNAFRADPIKYGAGRVRVHVSRQTEREATAAEPSPEASASPLASPSSGEDDLAPGGPPEPPGTDDGANPPPSSDEPLGNGPLNQAPEAPPAQGVQPTPQSVNDAPSVDEQLPSELPAKAPSVPDMGEQRPAARKTGKTSLPKAAPSTTAPDANGFSLPPDLQGGPPPRKTGASKKKSGGDDAPSVDEPADSP
jgi:YHS domain-containing protein